MAGIYIHIPFCRQKCHYCNFYSLASSKYRGELVPSLVKELELQREYLEGSSVQTIYFGGGTPSMLKAGEISQLLSVIHQFYPIDPDAEITLEATPDDLSLTNLKGFKKAGVNRLSIGIQSFEDEDLQFLNRTHSARQAYNCVKRSQDAGFHNLSIDLIYGIPILDSTSWEFNLLKAIELDVPHISAYALTVEEKTPLAVLIKKGKLADVEDAQQAEHFDILTSLLKISGYLHYEISNFCKPGMFSRHNTAYWKGTAYLGIGPSAHSFNGVSRQWNVSDTGKYIQSLQQSKVPFEQEVLSPAQRFNEYVMTSLRTMWGCDLGHIRETFGPRWADQVADEAKLFISKGLLKNTGEVLFLTPDGKFRADGIAAEFFRV